MPQGKVRLLISARGAGAARHLAVVALNALADNRFEPVFIADDPGLSVFAEAGLAPEAANMGNSDPENRAEFTRAVCQARHLIDQYRPDAILTGYSAPGAGVDEYLLREAAGAKTYAFQDYWGYVNSALPEKAGLYFTVDQLAAETTRTRHGVDTEIVGAPRYASYEKFDFAASAVAARAHIGVSGDRPIAVVMGQGLSEFRKESYRRTVLAYYRAALERMDDPALVYRPHPRESLSTVAGLMAFFSQEGLSVISTTEFDTETWLSAATVIGTFYSNCGYELALLNRLAPHPLGALIYMGFEEDIRSYFSQVSSFETVPVLEMSLAIEAQSAADIGPCISRAADAHLQQSLQQKARDLLPAPIGAATRILNRIAADQGLRL
jgi:hypothetical protein